MSALKKGDQEESSTGPAVAEAMNPAHLMCRIVPTLQATNPPDGGALRLRGLQQEAAGAAPASEQRRVRPGRPAAWMSCCSAAVLSTSAGAVWAGASCGLQQEAACVAPACQPRDVGLRDWTCMMWLATAAAAAGAGGRPAASLVRTSWLPCFHVSRPQPRFLPLICSLIEIVLDCLLSQPAPGATPEDEDAQVS